MSVNSRLNPTQIKIQRKAFCWQRIPESRCARKKLLTQTPLQHLGMVTENPDHAICQNNEYTSLKEVEPVGPVHMNIYQSITYGKDLSWLHFE